jgi:ubiquinone/menaquinone biosynthesis C-methylase UbiE
LTAYYEQSMFSPLVREFTGGSDFHNFGYWHPQTRSYQQACHELLDRLLALAPDGVDHVLDVACGKGETTAYVAGRTGARLLTGIDYSEKALQIAKTKTEAAAFMRMDATALQFADEVFDLVLCVEAAFHFNTREGFFAEARRVLRPGGRLVVADVLATREAESRRRGRTAANYLEGLEAYGELLRRTGFEVVALQDVTRECWHGHYHAVSRFAHTKLLAKQLSAEQLWRFLQPNLQRVPDLTCYLFAAGERAARH